MISICHKAYLGWVLGLFLRELEKHPHARWRRAWAPQARPRLRATLQAGAAQKEDASYSHWASLPSNTTSFPWNPMSGLPSCRGERDRERGSNAIALLPLRAFQAPYKCIPLPNHSRQMSARFTPIHPRPRLYLLVNFK